MSKRTQEQRTKAVVGWLAAVLASLTWILILIAIWTAQGATTPGRLVMTAILFGLTAFFLALCNSDGS